MVECAGKAIGFDVKIHPHMLRHACGFKLANDGVDTRTIQAYLGYKSIQHTVIAAAGDVPFQRPIYAPSPAFSWTGIYLGLGGGTWLAPIAL